MKQAHGKGTGDGEIPCNLDFELDSSMKQSHGKGTGDGEIQLLKTSSILATEVSRPSFQHVPFDWHINQSTNFLERVIDYQQLDKPCLLVEDYLNRFFIIVGGVDPTTVKRMNCIQRNTTQAYFVKYLHHKPHFDLSRELAKSFFGKKAHSRFQNNLDYLDAQQEICVVNTKGIIIKSKSTPC